MGRTAYSTKKNTKIIEGDTSRCLSALEQGEVRVQVKNPE